MLTTVTNPFTKVSNIVSVTDGGTTINPEVNVSSAKPFIAAARAAVFAVVPSAFKAGNALSTASINPRSCCAEALYGPAVAVAMFFYPSVDLRFTTNCVKIGRGHGNQTHFGRSRQVMSLMFTRRTYPPLVDAVGVEPTMPTWSGCFTDSYLTVRSNVKRNMEPCVRFERTLLVLQTSELPLF